MVMQGISTKHDVKPHTLLQNTMPVIPAKLKVVEQRHCGVPRSRSTSSGCRSGKRAEKRGKNRLTFLDIVDLRAQSFK